MEGLDSQTIIAVVALFTGLGIIFKLLLNPVYIRLSNLEAGQAKLETGQAKLEKRMDGIERKLDQLLAKT